MSQGVAVDEREGEERLREGEERQQPEEYATRSEDGYEGRRAAGSLAHKG